jgi:hypothetical protein
MKTKNKRLKSTTKKNKKNITFLEEIKKINNIYGIQKTVF